MSAKDSVVRLPEVAAVAHVTDEPSSVYRQYIRPDIATRLAPAAMRHTDTEETR